MSMILDGVADIPHVAYQKLLVPNLAKTLAIMPDCVAVVCQYLNVSFTGFLSCHAHHATCRVLHANEPEFYPVSCDGSEFSFQAIDAKQFAKAPTAL